MSPVDTGLFRANWQTKLDQPHWSGKTANRNGSIDHVIPLANEAGWPCVLLNKQSALCVKPLEYGHSDQAPNGIVRVSARNALRDLKCCQECTMSQAQIELALFDKLEAIKASLPTIYYPNSKTKTNLIHQLASTFVLVY